MAIRADAASRLDPVRENFAIAPAVSEAEPFWSRLFRRLVAERRDDAARFVWARVVSLVGPDDSYAPSPDALRAAVELSLSVPSTWADDRRAVRASARAD